VDYRAIPDKKNNELPASGVSTPRWQATTPAPEQKQPQ
jgi:hypothetical protein